jgi:transcriptional regulator with XRE-family HTH domain
MVGTRIKKLRQKRGLSVSELARRAGVSKSLISQIENGHANPSVETVRTVATVLEVPVFSLFLEEGGPQSALVRKNERVRLTVPGSETIRELLTTDLDREMVLVFSRIPPGAKSSPSPVTHKGEECTYVLKGALIQVMDDQEYVLEAGDAFYFDARIPHLAYNHSETEDVEFIAAMSPGLLPPA